MVWNMVCEFYINVGEWRKGKTRYESQRRYEERSMRFAVGIGMVARVTVKVVTPYVNPSIWSILQSKRIGFLWRWIASAGKLFLSASSSLHLFDCTSCSALFSFLCFQPLSSLPFLLLLCQPRILLLTSPVCLFSHIRINMIPCDAFQMPMRVF